MHHSSASRGSLNLRQLERILPPALETSVAAVVPCTQNKVCPEMFVTFTLARFHRADTLQVEEYVQFP